MERLHRVSVILYPLVLSDFSTTIFKVAVFLNTVSTHPAFSAEFFTHYV